MYTPLDLPKPVAYAPKTLKNPMNVTKISIAVLAGLWLAWSAGAQPPPPRVAVAPAKPGVIAPQAEFQGTVYFKEVSQVAAEVSGKVLAVKFEEGDRVTAGQLLVQIDTSLLEKQLQATRANLQKAKTDLADAKVRFDRAKILLDDEVTTPQEIDKLRFEVEANSHQVEFVQAELERIQTLIDKSSIYSPFDGIVLDRLTQVGEWRSSGGLVASTVAVVARENIFDVMADVPEQHLRWVTPGAEVTVNVGGRELSGEVIAVIPRGDIATRLFPVKIRVEDSQLMEGMSALVRLPVAEPTECILVPRDAILQQLNQTVVYTIEDGLARVHPVTVIGYDGIYAGIASPEVTLQHLYVVKGHERLRPGDKVIIISENVSGPSPANADG